MDNSKDTEVTIEAISNGYLAQVTRDLTMLGEQDDKVFFSTYIEALEYVQQRLSKYVDQEKAGVKVKGLS